MIPEPAGLAADDAGRHAWVARRIAVIGFIAFAVLQPAFNLFAHPLDGRRWLQVIGAVVLTALVCRSLTRQKPASQPVPWPWLAAILALGITLFALGGANWIATLAVTAAVFGGYSRTPTPALVGSAACAVAGLTVSVINGYQSGVIVAAGVIAPMAGLFSYTASRRAETLEMLKRTRAELARAAVAEERLRIARDMHDLLGHSLSLITLKAELAGRLIGADPDRAAREIAELETVARQSLGDVREAVAGYRQPDLAGELTAARQLLDAAGITSVISSTGATDLPSDVDAVLAWTVREGATNIVRHSQAARAVIKISADQARATAEMSDNGPAAARAPGWVAAWALPMSARIGPVLPVPAGPVPSSTAAVRTAAAAVVPSAVARAAADPTVSGLARPCQVVAGQAASGPAVATDENLLFGRARPAFAGSGLAGLAERVRGLGGELAAGAIAPRGFVLRVTVPVGTPFTESSSETGPANATMGK